MTPQTLANYLGQEAIDRLGMKFIITGHTIDLIQNFPSHIEVMPKLLLTPLSKITDEDLNELFKKLDWQNRYVRISRRRKELNFMFGEHKSVPDFTGWKATIAIDFLRSRGYAVGLKEDEYIDKTKV